MSTKIYSGFRFHTNDLFKIHQICRDFDKVAYGKDLEMAGETIGGILIGRHDIEIIRADPSFAKRMEVDENYSKHIQESDAKIAEVFSRDKADVVALATTFADDILKSLRDTEDSCICVIPIFDAKTGERMVVGICYLRRDLEELWMKQESVEEYGYWNNTDPPEEVSEQDLDMRKVNWDRALPSNSFFGDIPSHAGFCINIGCGKDRVTLSVYSAYWDGLILFPSMDERAQNVATKIMENRFYAGRIAEEDPYKNIKSWFYFSETPEFKTGMENLIEEVKPKLVDHTQQEWYINYYAKVEKKRNEQKRHN